MILEPHDAKLFFKLNRLLMYFVNQRLKVLAEDTASPEAAATLSPQDRSKIRDALLANVDLIESLAAENPTGLSEDELGILRSWRHLVGGKFYVFRELAKYTVFLSTANPAVAYGVVALSDPLEDLVGPHLPVLVETVLLPFKGRIIYDGLMSRYSITFGAGIRRSLNESFKEAKASYGIVTSLPMPDETRGGRIDRLQGGGASRKISAATYRISPRRRLPQPGP